MCKVQAGWGGYGKNKGSVAMRFRIDQTTFAFLNCHLESGEGNVLKRLDMLKTILKEAFTEKKFAPDTAHHNIAFIFGDLNFRIGMTNHELRDQIKLRNYDFIKQYDELLIIKNQVIQKKTGQYSLLTSEVKQAMDTKEYMAFLQTLSEGDIQFAPTYKFDTGTNDYDTSRKFRVPAYCDRIMFTNTPDKMKLLEYTSVPRVMFSDHRPVYASFQVFTQQVQNFSEAETDQLIMSL